jgi:cell division septum initiation protein DivIVA
MSIIDDMEKYFEKELQSKRFLTDAHEFIKNIKSLKNTEKELVKTIEALKKDEVDLSDKVKSANQSINEANAYCKKVVFDAQEVAKEKASSILLIASSDAASMIEKANKETNILADQASKLRADIDNLQALKSEEYADLNKIEKALSSAKSRLKSFMGD